VFGSLFRISLCPYCLADKGEWQYLKERTCPNCGQKPDIMEEVHNEEMLFFLFHVLVASGHKEAIQAAAEQWLAVRQQHNATSKGVDQ
jgi:hypothetical protein